MDRRRLSNGGDEMELRAEIERLHKMVEALMNHAERGPSARDTDFCLFQSSVVLEEQVRQRTEQLEAALRENEKMTRALRESEAKFHNLLEYSAVGINLCDSGRFLYANPKFAEITGYGADELLQLGPLDITPENARAELAAFLRQGLAGKTGHVNFTANIVRKDGAIRIVEISGGPAVEIEGRPALIGAVIDVTDKIRAENEIRVLNARLREQAVRDPLTGLFNRRYLEDSLERELLYAQRQARPVSVVMGDLDHFKAVNDNYGHQTGDEMLHAFGELLRQHSRGSDIQCRYGGEEFILVLPDMDLQKACELAERLRAAVQEMTAGGVMPRMSASFGVATYPQHASSGRELIGAADRALYRAKEGGRNRVCGAEGVSDPAAAGVAPNPE